MRAVFNQDISYGIYAGVAGVLRRRRMGESHWPYYIKLDDGREVGCERFEFDILDPLGDLAELIRECDDAR